MDAGERAQVLDGFLVEVRKDCDRGGGCCDFPVATGVGYLRMGCGIIGVFPYLVKTRVIPGIEYRCCRAACGSCVMSKARWKQTEKRYEPPIRVRWCDSLALERQRFIHKPGNVSDDRSIEWNGN